MLLATALALLITGCAQQTFTVQNKPAAKVAPKPSPSFLRFWNWAKKTVDAAKICGGAKYYLFQTANIKTNGCSVYIRRFLSARKYCGANNVHDCHICQALLPYVLMASGSPDDVFA